MWLDEYAMLVGSFTYRMDEALRSGASAGVLVATPDVRLSKAIQTVEFPALARLSQESHMLLGVVSPLRRSDGSVDEQATAGLYDPIPDFDLADHKHYGADRREDLFSLARDFVIDRMRALRPETERAVLRIDVATRDQASDSDRTGCASVGPRSSNSTSWPVRRVARNRSSRWIATGRRARSAWCPRCRGAPMPCHR